MVGSTKDPEDGKAVAASVFAAVIVYAVRIFLSFPLLRCSPALVCDPKRPLPNHSVFFQLLKNVKLTIPGRL